MPDEFNRGFEKGLANTPADLNASLAEIHGQQMGEQRRNERAIFVNLGRRAIGIAAAILIGICAAALMPGGGHNRVEIGLVAAIFVYIIVMMLVKRRSKP